MIYYECQCCTACCRWPGQVKISEVEIATMAAHLGVDQEEFIQRYTRLRADRRGLSLVEKPNHECIFLDGMDCRVQTVKPQQCRDFPNKWNFPGWERICRAIPREVPLEQVAS
jgi:Fe-S-cluster containining protein